ncbi:Rtr1/RPAP2 family-domain-containing protein [Lipomyces arxii]|uniref:Rtr1/RPAP2 family-domain-containing protein n=1 Tax=Lipomyces arxii TaxID=56418 RepID=UPI0034CD5EA1
MNDHEAQVPLIRFSNQILRQYVQPGMLSPKNANTLVLRLTIFMTDTVDATFLKYASRFLTPEYYNDIVAERNVLHICGYPLCDKSPTRKVFGKESPQINYEPSASKVPGNSSSYLNSYCSKLHFQASIIYKAQLSDEALWARPDIAYLRNGTAQWENSISLLDDLLVKSEENSKAAIGEVDLTHSEMKDVLMSLPNLTMQDKDQDIQKDTATNNTDQPTETLREKIEEAKKENFKESSLNMKISERSLESTKRFISSVDSSNPNNAFAVEGYVVQPTNHKKRI